MQIHKKLSEELDFTDEDLAANQRGELTEHQRERLRKKRMWESIIVGVMLILPTLLLISIAQRSLDSTGVFLIVVAILWILLFSLIG